MVPAWLDWQPRISLPLWLALATVFAITWIAYAVRCRKGIPSGRRVWTLGAMLIAGSVPLILLLNPTWVEALPPPEGRPLVTVVIDSSASMDVDDGADDQTRLERATQLADEILDSFDDSYETRLLRFDRETGGADLSDLSNITPGQRTDIAAAIGAAAGSDRPRGQAVILLSDGVHNVGSSRRVTAAAKAARGRGAPIFPVAVGRPITVKNLSVDTGSSARLAFVDQPVRLSAKIDSRGFDSAPVDVNLLRDGELIETQSLSIDKDQNREVVFTANPEEPGLYRYSISVGSLPSEATGDDNSGSLLVRVIDSPIGVLLLEGKPYWDSKFLARNLAADPSVQLESLVMLRADRFLHRKQNFDASSVTEPEIDNDNQPDDENGNDPTPPWQILSTPSDVIGSAASLQKYQVIVLGRDAEAYLDDTTVSRLRSWVAGQGGSLVCARGAPQSTLSEKLGLMLPVRWTQDTERRYRAQVTEMSGREGWLVDEGDPDPLQSMPSLVTGASPKKRGGLPRVLVSGDTAGGEAVPIVTYQPYGAGRTVVVEGVGMWRWALLPPEFAESDETYPRVWNGLLQWLVSRVALAPGQDRALQSDRMRFSTDVAASATLLVRDTVSTEEMPKAWLTREGSEERTEVICEPAGDQPGVFQARFGKLPVGNYRATLQDAADSDRSVAAFEVRRPVTEALDLNPRDDLLNAIAKESGGTVLKTFDAKEISKLIEQQITDGMPVETRRTPAWDRWWVLAGILGMWTAAWTLRRRSGLI